MVNSIARAEARNPSDSAIPVEPDIADLLDRGIVLEVHALTVITALICEKYGSEAACDFDIGLAALASGIAEHVSSHLGNLPLRAGGLDLFEIRGMAGGVDAILHAVHEAHCRVANERDEEARWKLINRVAWLQATAHDLVNEMAEAVSPKEVTDHARAKLNDVRELMREDVEVRA